MAKIDPITQALAITDISLREFFPNDYYKRCMYASFGVAALLEDDEIPARIVGGDFICAVVSKDGAKMGLQGFGTPGVGDPSHYWIETHGQRLDLGPMYLPYESSFPASPLPVLRWPLTVKLPNFVAYREREHYANEVEISNPEFRQRNVDFVSHCRAMRLSLDGHATLGTWQLKDSQSLRYAAEKGDPWARAAIEFLRRAFKAEFPFHRTDIE